MTTTATAIRTLSGPQVLFEYHCWESKDSADAELWRHTHQAVDVLYQLDNPDQVMYRVRFGDGLEYDVFEDELMDSPAGYERP